jgi:hypothetical protein
VLGRFTSADPLSATTPRWTPYRYGFNNPLIMIDPTGMTERFYSDQYGTHHAVTSSIQGGYSAYSTNDEGSEPQDVIYLLWSPQEGKEGSSGQSSGNVTHHSAILIGDDENGWNFYSKSGGNYENGEAKVETRSFDNLDDFYKYFGQYSGYDIGLLIETTKEQDILMKQMAESDKTTTYEGFSNNCADFCRNVIKAAGIPFKESKKFMIGNTTMPAREIQALEHSNPNSQRILFQQNGRSTLDSQTQRAFQRLERSRKDVLFFQPNKQ